MSSSNSELWKRINERKAKIAGLGERDKKLWDLAHKAYNAMGFACQGAGQQNESMEIRYEQQGESAMREFESVLLNDRCDPLAEKARKS